MADVEIKLGRWMGAVPIEQGSEKGRRGERGLYRKREAHQKHEIKRTKLRCQIEVSCGGTSSPGELTTTRDYAASGAQAVGG